MSIEKLFKHRSALMGIAILWIILFHSTFSISNRVLGIIREVGYGGVDIFAFVAGIGGYYSFSKNYNELAYYRRRVKRILSVYIPFMAVWLSYQVIINQMPIQAIIGNLFLLQRFTGLGYEFNWYLSYLVITYAATPFLVQMIDRIKKSGRVAIIVFIIAAISVAFWKSENLIIIIRIPLYIMGIYVGRLGKEGVFLRKKHIACLSLSLR